MKPREIAVRCEICCLNLPQVKDYRRGDIGYDKYLVCPNCFMLADKWFFKLRNAKEGLGKKKILAQIIEGNWKNYLIATKVQKLKADTMENF